MDTNQSRKILFEEENAEEDLRLSYCFSIYCFIVGLQSEYRGVETKHDGQVFDKRNVVPTLSHVQ